MTHQKGLYPFTPQNEKRPEQDSNLRPSAPEADALSAELSGPGYLKCRCNRTREVKKPVNADANSHGFAGANNLTNQNRIVRNNRINASI